MTYMIYQVAVGPERELYETCMNSVARYCARFGIKHVIQREPSLRITPLRNHRSPDALRLGYLPIFEKENALALLPDHDAVCVIDSDIYIRDHAPMIFDHLGETCFAGVIERDIPLVPRHVSKIRKYSQAQYGPLREEADFLWNDLGAAFFNMGVMLMHPSILQFLHGQSPRQFILRPEFERFVNGEGAWRWSTDQTLLNYWLRRDAVPCQYLDWRWNALYGAVPNDRINTAWFVHFFLADHHVGTKSVQIIIDEMDACRPE